VAGANGGVVRCPTAYREGMKLAAMRLRQRDGITCGPTVAVVAGALLDADYRAALIEPGASSVAAAGRLWFADEQARVHRDANRWWPRRLGTTPMGMAHALSACGLRRGVRYGWRLFRGRRDPMHDVVRAVGDGLPVAMLIGRFIPRHWVLILEADDDFLQCYEPSSGEVMPVRIAAVRRSLIAGLGYPRPFAFVLPR